MVRSRHARPLLSVLALACATLVGCKPSKKEKCEKIVDEAAKMVEALSKAFGKEEKMTDADRKAAIDKCIATPDDELECAMKKDSKDPKCVELQRKKAHVDWETATVDEGKTKAQIPKGWKHENFMGDSYSPEEAFGTSYRISHTCGGVCEAHSAAEWEKIIGDEITRFRDANAKVVKDEKPNATARVVVTDQGNDAKELEVTLWHEGAPFYVKCSVRLDMPYVLDIDAFEKACLASEVTWGESK
ncbi:MAG: hypothetical protein U0414_16665 [Polyangiaceae bacterium]